MLNVENSEAYISIVDLMKHHGFKMQTDGSLWRRNTGCSFSFECLKKYESLMDFQLDWPYTYD